MNIPSRTRRFNAWIAVAGALLVAGCAGGGGASWTYAPLGPTPSAGGASEAPASPGGSPAGSPGGSPGGSPAGSPGGGVALETVTPPEQPLAFVPDVLEMPAATSVTVTYVNDSNLPHNINFFEGQDATAPSLGMTETVTGPDAPESVTFTTPSEPGDYYFWCDVHGAAMDGTYRVT